MADTKYNQTLARKIYRILWGLAILMVLGGILFFIILSRQDLPTFEELENPENELATVILDKNKNELDRLFIQNRVPVAFEELNPYIVQALISTEDERYYKHAGIDLEALGRVGVKSLLLRKKSQGGGSTITQQLAKLMYPRIDLSNMSKIQQIINLGLSKFKEWITAVKLERSYTKEEIIAMYLNKFDFIYDSYGVRAAAETYFGKEQEDLMPEEAAVIVAMLNNPWYYNPKKFPENSMTRRNIVLAKMEKHGYLSQTEFDSLRFQPIDMTNFKRKTQSDGLAPYLKVEIQKRVKEILAQPETRKPDGTEYDLFKDGLQIETTIDPVYQRLALEAVTEHMPKLQASYFRHWKGMNPFTYDMDDQQKAIVQATLDRMVHESDRYQTLRYARIGTLLQKMQEEVANLVYTDTEIEWMIDEGKKPGRIAGLQSKGIIRKDKAQRMRDALKSQEWEALKVKYQDLQKETAKVFDTKTTCRIFDYLSPGFEKDSVMTPMDSIKYHMEILQTGVMVMDPTTGFVKAWVGGVNHKYFKFDHVTSNRQVGSTFKPFVYTTAVMNNISPCTEVIDQPYTIAPGENNFHIPEPWTPKNSHEFTGKKMNLYQGLRESVNSLSVFLMKSFGSAEPVRETAISMGLNGDEIPSVPSICLGTPELTVEELTGAYGVFANNGEYNKPIIIQYIRDRHGRLIYQNKLVRHRALNEKTNYVMVRMLEQSIGNGKLGLTSPEVGGKTGTTNNHVDGWFMGIHPRVVIGTWVGGDYGWIRFRTLDAGQGAVMARPIFNLLMRKLETLSADEFDAQTGFSVPAGRLGITIDCEDYKQEPSAEDVFDVEQGLQDEFDIIH
ncbi:MAG TPA: transglycosylase domain-containing protein [Saprospiraceae bacterium]|nr:transglycosylase domain-containing protein [Saprospiraceae bacterium]